MNTQVMAIQKALQSKTSVDPVTVRQFLSWFGFQRRGANAVDFICSELSKIGLETIPDFSETWIDGLIEFQLLGSSTKAEVLTSKTINSKINSDGTVGVGSGDSADGIEDPSFRVGILPAANKGVISVKPQDTLTKAITLMHAYNYSQLAVMQSERELKGTISWRSIGCRLAQGHKIETVAQATEVATEVLDSASLGDATRIVLLHDYAFVKSSNDKRIIGIVTATDLSEQFEELSEPFLILAEIEKRLRPMIHKLGLDVIKNAVAEFDSARKEKVKNASDLTFGEYVRILENEKNWLAVGLKADRAETCSLLRQANTVRNEVMHFHPDGIGADAIEKLRQVLRLLRELDRLSKS